MSNDTFLIIYFSIGTLLWFLTAIRHIKNEAYDIQVGNLDFVEFCFVFALMGLIIPLFWPAILIAFLIWKLFT